MTEYYKENLEIGLEYQDFVCNILLREFGIPVISFSSRKYQLTGENKQGIEIKCQAKFKKYDNLYIEICEKSNEANERYIPSGIYRADNTWLFCTGDYETIYIFSVKHLRMLHDKKIYREVEPRAVKTSKGFLLPKIDAEKYCIKKIEIGE
jgi:hypothetical protein